MSLLRSSKSKSVERPSLLVRIKVCNKRGHTLDEQEVWQALVDCFSKHPYLDVSQATVFPDKDAPVAEPTE